MVLLALAGAAVAFTADRVGGYVDYGLGASTGPGVGAALGVGIWKGSSYDDELSFGRFWSLGLGVAQSVRGDALRTAWTLEARRGVDLIVVGVHGFASAGPVLVQDEGRALGVAGRIGGAAELRRTSTLGIALRVEGGADWIDGHVAPAGMVTLGVQTVFIRASQ